MGAGPCLKCGSLRLFGTADGCCVAILSLDAKQGPFWCVWEVEAEEGVWTSTDADDRRVMENAEMHRGTILMMRKE